MLYYVQAGGRRVFSKDKLPDIDGLNTLSEYIALVLPYYKERICVRYCRTSGEVNVTYEEFYQDVKEVENYFLFHHIRNERIALVGDASYEWLVFFLAIISSGNTAVPIQSEVGELEDNLQRSEVTYIFFHSNQQTRLKNILDLFHHIKIFTYNSMMEHIHTWKQDVVFETVDRVLVKPEDCAMMVFTSGTSGKSKIVMLSQQNIMHDVISITKLLASSFHIGERIITILPVYHMLEVSTGILVPFFYGASICISEGARYTLRDIKYYKPTVAVVVPTIVETFTKKIWSEARKQGNEEKLKRLIAISEALRKCKIDLRKIFFRQIHNQFGGELNLIVSGGAALNETCMEFMEQVGLTIYQGYGITECAPVVSCNTKEKRRKGSIGIIPKQKFYEVKIIEGEICVKGSIVMTGYYKEPEETQKAVQGGWFHTGDLGYIDSDGFLFLTGRKKNLIILSDGNNVSPEELEQKIGENELIQSVLVKTAVKNENTVIVADVFLDREIVKQRELKEPEQEVKAYMRELNSSFPSYKRIRDITFLTEDIPKNKMGKVRRQKN